MAPKNNVHVHLFTADHSPEIQFFYLLWNVFEGMFVRKRLFGVIHFSTDKLAKAGRCLRLLLWLAKTIPFVGKFLDDSVSGLVRTVETLTHASSAQIFAKLGILDQSRPGQGAAGEILKRIRDHSHEEFPFNAVLASIAKDLYKLHDEGRGSEFAVTQESLLAKFFEQSKDGGKAEFKRIVPLTVNFDCAFLNQEKYGLRVKPDVDFAGQVREIAALATKLASTESGLPKVELAPFLCVDPRYQPENGQSLLEWVKANVHPRGCYRGIKIYPPMGFRPSDELLKGIFAWCKAESIPVTSHCSLGGAGLRGLDEQPTTAHPDEWRPVLEELKRTQPSGVFRLNLAHFSDLSRNLKTEADQTWSGKIIDIMRDYNSTNDGIEIYSDISYAWVRAGDYHNFERNVRSLKALGLDRWVLFGSDWWNYLPDCNDEVEYAANIHFQELFDAETLDRNADRFLALAE